LASTDDKYCFWFTATSLLGPTNVEGRGREGGNRTISIESRDKIRTTSHGYCARFNNEMKLRMLKRRLTCRTYQFLDHIIWILYSINLFRLFQKRFGPTWLLWVVSSTHFDSGKLLSVADGARSGYGWRERQFQRADDCLRRKSEDGGQYAGRDFSPLNRRSPWM